MKEKKPIFWMFFGGLVGGLGTALAGDLNDLLKAFLPKIFASVHLGGFHFGLGIVIAVLFTMAIIIVSFHMGFYYVISGVVSIFDKEGKYLPLHMRLSRRIGNWLFPPSLFYYRWQRKRNPPEQSESVEKILQQLKEKKHEPPSSNS